MAPESTKDLRGTVQRFKDARGRMYWRARITLPDGERVWLKPRFDKKERAQEYADEKAREAEKRGITATPAPTPATAPGESCDAWHGRYLAYCRERGIVTTGDKGYRWGKWISPTIGAKTMADVTKEDAETIRDALDAAILDGRLSAKTAQNAWGELTVSFGEACSSKRKDLRARTDNPCLGVQPPETGTSRSKVYPYPSELRAVASCIGDQIPLAWRQIHVIAAYTYLRPGELWVLEWSDVDLDDEKIHVTKAWDFKNKRVKGTKTHETREVPIEANLLALLKAMHAAAGGKGLVVPALAQADDHDLGVTTREHFEAAGCKRPRLVKNTKTERHVVFRSWRDAGITWAIVRGDDVIKVQRRAGHKLIATTQRYIVEAENRGATFGVPFGPLPASLLEASKDSSKSLGVNLQAAVIPDESSCERRDLNPHESDLART
jgi:integrase